MGRLAILAGAGRLPALLAQGHSPVVVRFAGVGIDALPDGVEIIEARFERLVPMFEDLRARGVREVALAGAMRRPALDPTALDPATAALMPRILAAMGKGDDGLLRAVLAVIEEQGFAIRAPHDIRPDLVAQDGLFSGTVTPQMEAWVARADAVLAALSPLDVGQGAVVAQGQVLAIETLPGTDAMLRFVAAAAPRSGGVLRKRPKIGQDLRVDMPGIGPDTITLAAEAGLACIALGAGGVMILDRDETIARARALGITLWAVA